MSKLTARAFDSGLTIELSFGKNELGVHLREANRRVESFLKMLRVGAKEIYSAMLIVEEQISNALRHGKNRDDGVMVNIGVYVRNDNVHLCIEDDGARFDPLSRTERTPATSLADLEVGGLGLGMIQHAADRLHYRRIQAKNVLEARIPRQVSPLSLPTIGRSLRSKGAGAAQN